MPSALICTQRLQDIKDLTKDNPEQQDKIDALFGTSIRTGLVGRPYV